MEQRKAVVVMGGTSGIGKDISTHLVQLGYTVASLGPVPDKASDHGLSGHHIETDIAVVGSYPAAMQKAQEQLGRIDVLINALDDYSPTPWDAVSPTTWSDILDYNAKAVFFSSQAVVPFMKHDGGIIVNLTSVRGMLAARDQVAYSAAKAGVAAMTRDLATDLGRYSIKCNSLMLYPSTPLNRPGTTSELVGSRLNRAFAGGGGLLTPGTADVCEAVASLITDGAYFALDAFDYPLDAGTSILLDPITETAEPVLVASLLNTTQSAQPSEQARGRSPQSGVTQAPGSKVAVFTGGARGLGAASARVFAERGVRVAILDILDEQGQDLAEELRELADAEYFHCDVADNQAIFDTIDAVHERFGRIDILLSAAAITSRKRTPEISEADWDIFMDIDLKGSFYMAMACAKYMKEVGGGRIVNFSSMLSTLSHGRHTLYGGAKEALNSMTRAMAAALKPDNIQVFSVLPAYVVTPMISFRLTDQEWIDRNYRQSLSKVLLMPEHVTDIFWFLAASKTAASSGHKIYVDTGYLNFRYKLVPWDEAPAPIDGTQTENKEALADANN